MKKLIILAGLLMLSVIRVPDGSTIQMSLVGNAQAGTTATEVGGTTYYSGDTNGTSTTVGGTTYYSINGQSGTSTTVGGTTYYSGSLFNNNN